MFEINKINALYKRSSYISYIVFLLYNIIDKMDKATMDGLTFMLILLWCYVLFTITYIYALSFLIRSIISLKHLKSSSVDTEKKLSIHDQIYNMIFRNATIIFGLTCFPLRFFIDSFMFKRYKKYAQRKYIEPRKTSILFALLAHIGVILLLYVTLRLLASLIKILWL